MEPIKRPVKKDQADHGKTKVVSPPREASKSKSQSREEDSLQIAKEIEAQINKLAGGLSQYTTYQLVKDSENLGKSLAVIGLKTNQIRKILDVVKRLKTQQRLQNKKTSSDDSKEESETKAGNPLVYKVSGDLPLLLPQIAYAAARQRKFNKKIKTDFGPVDPLEKVLKAAIKKVRSREDLLRLVQFVESIVAYHKAAGGKDQ